MYCIIIATHSTIPSTMHVYYYYYYHYCNATTNSSVKKCINDDFGFENRKKASSLVFNLSLSLSLSLSSENAVK